MRNFILFLTTTFLATTISAPALAESSEIDYLVVASDTLNAAEYIERIGGEVQDIHYEINTLKVSLDRLEYGFTAARYDIFEVREYSSDTTQSPTPNWGIDRLDQAALPLTGSFTSNHGGAGVNIYVMDSGVRSTHQEFGSRVSADSVSFVNDGNGLGDCTGHGTHVAGIAAGSTYGVAKQATITSVRVIGCDGSTNTLIVADAINWVIEHHQAGEPAVINMSFGSDGSDSYLNYLVGQLVLDGILVVAAAGNSAVDACNTSPGSAPDAINVAASAINDSHASYSNHGSCVDLYAPGGDGGNAILSASSVSDTGGAWAAGTSMAAPHVAGLAALYFESLGTSDVNLVRQEIFGTAVAGAISNPPSGTPNVLANYSDRTVSAPTPAPAEPTPSEPAPAPTPAPAEPTPSEPAPAPSEPAPAEPTPSEPAPAPAPAEPTPSEPAPAPAPSEPTPSEPTPSEPEVNLDAPSAPNMFSYDVVSKSKLRLRWLAPESSGDSDLHAYRIIISDPKTNKTLRTMTISASRNSVILSQPKNAKKVTISITASNKNKKIGESLIVPEVAFPVAPGKVSKVKKAYPAKGKVTLSWVNPSTALGNGDVSYQIRVSRGASTRSWNAWKTYKGYKDSVTLSGLPSKKLRYVEIRVVTAGGVGKATRTAIKVN